MSNVLLVKNLEIEFNAPEGVIDAVKDVSFRIPHGKTVAIVGESGSGKSVISQAIMGILPKNGRVKNGSIVFENSKKNNKKFEITKLKNDSNEMRSIRGSGISIIFQEPMTSLSPLHTIGNQISEAYSIHNKSKKNESIEATKEILQLVGFPNAHKAIDNFPFELSGGLRQRAMIAMAMICKPSLLIADEPTTALDVTVQAQILKLMNDLKNQLNMSILMITHDLGVVANMADEIIVMYHGKVMEQGNLNDIFNKAEHPYLKALLKAVPRFNMEKNERLVPIREIKTNLKSIESVDNKFLSDEPILKVTNLLKTFSTRKNSMLFRSSGNFTKAVNGVSFEVPRGSCVGLVGESGCGKTTTSKIIMRAIRADSGNVVFNDGVKSIDILNMNKKEILEYRRNAQYIFQDPFSSLNPRMTVYDIINEPLVIHNIGNEKLRIKRVKQLMEIVGLPIQYLRRYPHSFSGGQRQRIGIARALALQPKLIICDEPVSALDVSIQAQVLNLLKDLKSQLGLTYLFISHNIAVIDYISDHIIVMCSGMIVESAPKSIFFNESVHPYTQALLAAVPEPNPEKNLNFKSLLEGRVSDPNLWPEPFTLKKNQESTMVNLGNNHWVRKTQ